MKELGSILLKISEIIFVVIIVLIAIFIYITKFKITDVTEFVNEENKYKIILIAIFIIAILVRTIFICKTNISEFQFDFGIEELTSEVQYDNLYENFDKEPNTGRHINYIMQLYTYN